MISIIVIDKEKKYIDSIKRVVNKLSIKHDKEIEIKIYDKYDKNLKSEIKRVDNLKIYIMDIELNSTTSGMTIAKKIRESDYDSEIIFITNHDSMFEIVHRTIPNVFAFIEKYIDFEKRLEQKISLIFNRSCNKMLTYKTRTCDINLYYKKIKYIICDKAKRKLLIVSDSGKSYIPIGLENLLNQLDSRFKKVHRSCIVNTYRVEKYDWKNNKIILDTGEELNYLSNKYRAN